MENGNVELIIHNSIIVILKTPDIRECGDDWYFKLKDEYIEFKDKVFDAFIKMGFNSFGINARRDCSEIMLYTIPNIMSIIQQFQNFPTIYSDKEFEEEIKNSDGIDPKNIVIKYN